MIILDHLIEVYSISRLRRRSHSFFAETQAGLLQCHRMPDPVVDRTGVTRSFLSCTNPLPLTDKVNGLYPCRSLILWPCWLLTWYCSPKSVTTIAQSATCRLASRVNLPTSGLGCEFRVQADPQCFTSSGQNNTGNINASHLIHT